MANTDRLMTRALLTTVAISAEEQRLGPGVGAGDSKILLTSVFRSMWPSPKYIHDYSNIHIP